MRLFLRGCTSIVLALFSFLGPTKLATPSYNILIPANPSPFCFMPLILSATSPGFYVSAVQVLKTLWGKDKLLVTSNFSFSYSIFYPPRELFAAFTKFRIVACKLLQSGRVSSIYMGIKRGKCLCESFQPSNTCLPLNH